ncbi:acylphosphatase [Suttonella sp. R2A3]|uniref:acylphosphatase n=1 Tax=Suttonella sp. R2A3 TaxID=2908648 RepID=UPI001F20F7CD|nr:acylphosphatase [Suttonella sp. R2A3]UJF24156.1 acylphosphatase [Suttonella sp. R2A3]
MLCKRFIVSGRVQGVAFRYYTQKQAKALEVCGYVRNLEDGRVEVLAQGDEAAIEALSVWLWQGPPAASVENVGEITCAADEALTNFVITD